MTSDYREADESELVAGIRSGRPLAMAETYHRTIPAAHAVARRLIAGAAEVEELLLAVYTHLWESPPGSGGLEGWIRRTVWSFGTDRLRATRSAPASPSAATLLPDLPSPDVRFLDAAERAIAELGDDQRRVLLLAHDKGVPTAEQDEGAAELLDEALITLAGPGSSAADRGALHEDGCDDLTGLGDWTLGLLGDDVAARLEETTESRPGCAALARTLRRGRRRIEGLPATPDMGHRILVTVLAGAGGVTVGTSGASAPQQPSPQPVAEDEPAVILVASEEPGSSDDDDPFSPADVVADADDDLAAEESIWSPGGAVDALDETGPLPPAEALPGAGVAEDADDSGMLAGLDDEDDDPFADLESSDPGVTDTDELSASLGGTAAEEEPGSWAPTPGDTAELRLSDILAGEDEDDDPFALLEADADEEEAGGQPGGDPYAQLQDLGDGTDPAPAPTPRSAAPAPRPVVDDPAEDVYVEGEVLEEPARQRSGAGAFLLQWLLPILAGGGLGLVVAVLVFGS